MSRPVRVVPFPSGELGVIWDDGSEQFLTQRSLRLACPCAACVDELTGEQRLTPAQIAPSVRIERITPVGHYAIQVHWSDGHETGIYPFTLLRSLPG